MPVFSRKSAGLLLAFLLVFSARPASAASIFESKVTQYFLLRTEAGRLLTERLLGFNAAEIAESRAATRIMSAYERLPDTKLRTLKTELTRMEAATREALLARGMSERGFLRMVAAPESAAFFKSEPLQIALEREMAALESRFRLGEPPSGASTPQRRNPFFTLTAQRLPTFDVQGRALEAIHAASGNSSALRGIAADKLAFFKGFTPHPELDLGLAAIPSEQERLQSALEYALTTFRNPAFDQSFVEAIIKQLGRSPLSGERTIEVLLPLTRGARLASTANAALANEAILRIAQRAGTSFPPRLRAATPRRNPIDVLLHEPVVRVEALGGGVNSTLVVTLEDGSRAVFKPMAGEMGYANPGRPSDQILFGREVNAYDLVENWLGNATARARGLSRVQVPPTVETVLVHGGRSYGAGSLQLFMEGHSTAQALKDASPQAWAHIQESLAWKEAEARIRTIDYLIGNYDRLPNSKHRMGNLKNLLVAQSLGEPASIILIDNGIGRSSTQGFGIDNCPIRDHIPADLKKSILELDLDALRAAYQDRLSESGVADFISRVEAVRQRIRFGP